jgi:hypothetical protein
MGSSIQSEISQDNRVASRRLYPILFLIILTPMVEFLTRSTNFSELFSNPFYGVMFILVTEPGYILPVLLIREAVVAWKKGWSTLLILGIAYGAINEGLFAKTYFTFFPLSPLLGSGQGRFLGINWPWVTEISIFHMIVSMSVPIALSFLIFPETSSTRFFNNKTAKTLVAALVALVIPLNFFEYIALAPGFKGHLPLLVLPVTIIFVCIYLAYRLPVPAAKKQLKGFFAKPLILALASSLFFIVTCLPILVFFPISIVPLQNVSVLLYETLARSAIIPILYPLILTAFAIRFFTRYSLTQIQIWAILAGALLIPVLSALALPTFTQGAPFAALIYIAALWIAHRRISGDHLQAKKIPL